MSPTFRSVSYGPCSRTGVTCVASDNLVIDGRQMVSLVSVHGRGSLIYIASFTFLLYQLDSRVSSYVFFVDTECPVARQWSPTRVGLSRFVRSLNLWLSVLSIPPKSEAIHVTPVREQGP